MKILNGLRFSWSGHQKFSNLFFIFYNIYILSRKKYGMASTRLARWPPRFSSQNVEYVAFIDRAPHMKSSPNESTSPAKKSIFVCPRRYRRATDLKIGMVHLWTNVYANLKPIWKISIFFGPSSLVFQLGSTLEAQEFSK